MSERQAPPPRRLSVLNWALAAALIPLTAMAVTTVSSWVNTGAGGAGAPDGAAMPAGLTDPSIGGSRAQGSTMTAPARTAVTGPVWQTRTSSPRNHRPSARAPATGTIPPDTSPRTLDPQGSPQVRTTAAPGDPGPLPAPTPSGSPSQQVLALANQERAAAGCPPLTVDTSLATAAREHARDMVTQHYFGHTSPAGRGPAARATGAGYRGAVGENIAVGYADAVAVMDAWLESSGHRANIDNCAYTTTGIGFDPGMVTPRWGSGAWVQVFGMD